VLNITFWFTDLLFRDCKEVELEPNALDDDMADKLWDLSLELCGIPKDTTTPPNSTLIKS